MMEDKTFNNTIKFQQEPIVKIFKNTSRGWPKCYSQKNWRTHAGSVI